MRFSLSLKRVTLEATDKKLLFKQTRNHFMYKYTEIKRDKFILVFWTD